MVLTLAKEIIAGRRLTRTDDFALLKTAPLDDLRHGAQLIREALCGDQVELCSIVNGRSGRCSEDCKFCAQSHCYNTDVDEYDMLSVDEFVSACCEHERKGVRRFSIVTAGKGVHGADFDHVLAAYAAMKGRCHVQICGSHGFQTLEEFQALHRAGVDRAHINLETSRRHFPSICTTHTYQDKIENIQRAQQAGLTICSGGIFGLGETLDDRIDMALDLAQLNVCSIPINLLNPIPGTPLAAVTPLPDKEILRSIAIYRYLNPNAWIRMAAGRSRFADGGVALFQSGANATITGDMLTTTGTNISQDLHLLTQLGFATSTSGGTV